MRNFRRLVLDASVAVKWYLDDEPHVAEARALLIDFEQGHVALAAPSHIRYELCSAISVACRRGRLSEEVGREAIDDFLSWDIEVIDQDQLLRDSFAIARRFGCAFYDALYLALAEAARCSFVYADSRLRGIIQNRAPYALWLGEYVPIS